MSAQRERLDLYDRLHDGESGINVLCGRREHIGGGSCQHLEKGVEHLERKQRVSTTD